MYHFDSVFHVSGEQISVMSNELRGDVTRRLDRMIELIREMQQLEKVVSHVMDHSAVKRLYEDFQQETKGVNRAHSAMYDEIAEWRHRLQLETEFYDGKKSGSMSNTLLSSAFVLAGYVFSGGIAMPATGLLSAVVNGGVMWVSNRNMYRAQARLEEMSRLREEVDRMRNETVAFVDQFEHYKHQYQVAQQLERQRLQYLTYRVSKQATLGFYETFGKVSQFVNLVQTHQTEILVTMLLASWIFIFALIVRRHQKLRLNIIAPRTLLMWTLAFFIGSGMLLVFVDMIHSMKQTRLNKLHHFRERRMTLRQQNMERYRHECVWHELSVSRQLSLEGKALLWTVALQDGIRMLTTNSSGHLINDDQCLKYLQPLEEEFEVENEAQFVGETYMSMVVGMTREFLHKVVIDSFERVHSRTSFMTKMWALVSVAVVCLVFVIALTRRCLWLI